MTTTTLVCTLIVLAADHSTVWQFWVNIFSKYDVIILEMDQHELYFHHCQTYQQNDV